MRYEVIVHKPIDCRKPQNSKTPFKQYQT